MKIEQLQRVADADGKLYDAYLQGAKRNRGARGTGKHHPERVISPAGVPTDAIFPKHALFYAGAVALGGMLGVMLALAANLLQTSVRMGAEAEQMFGFPVIGNIPDIARKTVPLASREQRS